jgi:hypothetical protein
MQSGAEENKMTDVKHMQPYTITLVVMLPDDSPYLVNRALTLDEIMSLVQLAKNTQAMYTVDETVKH